MLVSPDARSALAAVSTGPIEEYARLTPEFPAVVEPDGPVFTYLQFQREMHALSDLLGSAGIQSHHTVAILVPQGALALVALSGVVHRCCSAPLNPSLTLSEIESHLVKMQAAAIVLTPEFAAVRELAAGLGITIVLAEAAGSSCTWSLGRVERLASTATLPEAAVVLNTSATTGQSKLVPLTHANLLAMFENTRTALCLTSHDRLLLVTPTFHAQGFVSSFAQFLAGGTVLATRGFEAASYRGWLTDLRPTWYTAAPAIHQAVVTIFESRPLKEPCSLRFVRSSGAAFTVDLARELRRALGAPILNGYGMSETGAVASDGFDERLYKPGSVGRSVGPKIAIMHASGALLAAGEEGEIVIGGPSVMLAYANNPEANRAAFRDGWFRTGDLGRLDADGFLFVTGRSKEMINRGGQKIVPDEVDVVLARHPAVREVVAFAVPHPTLGEDIACAVIPHVGVMTSEAELRRFAGQKLAPFKVPRRIYFVDEIPRGDTGKPKRHLLAQRIADSREAAKMAGAELASALPGTQGAVKAEFASADPESNPTVRRIIEIWARVLKRDEVDLGEDFFTAGGDSLGAVNLLAELDLRFGTDLQSDAASFLDDPTLANLAGRMSKARAADFAPASSAIEVFPVREAVGQAAVFCIPGDGDEGLYFRRLAKHLEGVLPLSVVRPVDTWHGASLYTIEESAAATVAAIQRTQAEGPYLISGYCYGGIVAFAAARLLRAQGHAVRLILFDVPMPGFPNALRAPGRFLERARAEFRELRRGRGIAQPGPNLRRLIRRGLWFGARAMRGVLARGEHLPAVRWALDQSQRGYLPFYTPFKMDVPILHFLSIAEKRPIRGASRLGWKRMAGRDYSEHWVPFDHDRHFRESNLPAMAEAIAEWSGLQMGEVDSVKQAELLSA